MQLNNFEKLAQQKLGNREIKPSANSWDRLDAMLSIEEKPKKKGFFWIKMAASFVVFASIGFYFYNQNEVAIPVKEESIIVEENSEFRIQNSENTESTKEVLVESNKQTKENKNSLIIKQQVIAISQPTTYNPQAIYCELIPKPIITYNPQPTTKNKYTSAEKLLAEISNSKKDTSKSYVQISKSGKSRISVSSETLLADAEKEIDKSFKSTILKKLNKNYQELTTAIANRNYEEE